MKRKLIIFVLFFLVLSLLVFENSTRFVRASGGFEITYLGSPLSGPIFDIKGMMPGDCTARQVKAKNDTGQEVEVKVKSKSESDPDNLASQINFEIVGFFTDTLDKFYDVSNSSWVSLGKLGSGGNVTYEFKACFKESAGNEFQKAKTKFDLVFATNKGHQTPELPAECKNLEGKISHFIMGDSGNNHLKGTSEIDFIDGMDGNDHIEGGSGSDCLVGGPGNDKIEGEQGSDFLLGNAGNDDLRGGSGNDYLSGGPGNDTLRGDSGIDECKEGENLHSCEL